MLFILLGIACTSQTPKEVKPLQVGLAGGRLMIDTSAGWSLPSWSVKRDKLQIIKTQATIDIPSNRPLKGAALELEGAWYNIELSVNGKALRSVTGGLMPIQIPVGDFLVVGKNHFDLTITAPAENTSSRITGGRLFTTHKNAQKAKLMRPPKLILRPQNHIRTMALSLTGDQVTPKARVSAPNGSTIEFEIWLDGVKRASLGKGIIENGIASGPTSKWTLPKWAPNKPELFMLKGILFDHNGKKTDHHAILTGAKDVTVSREGMRWNGDRFEMFAARIQGHDSPTSLGERIKPMTQGGINGLEIHGEMLRSDWLDFFDQNGIPVAFTPRCIGRTNYRAQEEIDQDILGQQDQRFIESVESRPAIALAVIEGKNSIPLWTNNLKASLNNIPIAGIDAPSGHIQMNLEKGLSVCRPKECRSHWIVEVALANETKNPPWTEIVNRYDGLTRSGIVGSVIPLPKRLLAKLNPKADKQWATAWKNLAQSKGIIPINGDAKRAPGKLNVRGMQAGSTVIIGINGQTDRASIADSNGSASLSLWHQGNLLVSSAGIEKNAALMPSAWRNFKWNGTKTNLDWPQ